MSKFIVITFFIIVFISGVLTYKDFGISWDEPIQRKLGLAVYNYIFNGSDQMFKSADRYYGSVFEFILVAVEKVLNFTSEKEIYYTRHLITFIFNFIGYIFFYKISQFVFKNRFLSLLAVSFLAFSPLIFAHSFYNSKDSVFMSGVIIASYFSLRFLNNSSTRNAFMAGFFCALAITIRIPGLFIPFISVILFVFKFRASKNKSLIFYIVFLIIFTYILWPLLWSSPLKEFVSAFYAMKKFPTAASTIFFGNTIPGDEIPWYFIPIWMGITIPFTQILLFICGVITIFKYRMEDTYKSYIMLWLVIPLASVILMRSVLYDGWRQMFFVYPGFILISIGGLKYLLDSKLAFVRFFVISAVLINLMQAVYFIYKWHPNQSVYFNFLAGEKSEISKKFSRDYWGLVYKQLYDYLSENDEREKVTVFVDTYPGETNIAMSKSPQKFELSQSLANSDYFLTNFRTGVILENSKKVYSVVVDGVEIGAVYKVN